MEEAIRPLQHLLALLLLPRAVKSKGNDRALYQITARASESENIPLTAGGWSVLSRFETKNEPFFSSKSMGHFLDLRTI